jgi:vacuolar-type H+-ATPase subunit F/Vma7
MTPSAHTRMIFLGEPPLADGFRLIGFETRPNPSVEDVERLIRELISQRTNAFVVIDQQLAEADIPGIRRVRREGGHILVSVVPALNQPDRFHTLIDDRLRAMFGAANTATQA